MRLIQSTLILFLGLALTTVAVQLAVIGVLDINGGRVLTTAAIAIAQGIAVAFLVRRSGGAAR